ncbi:glycosyltransferase family 4 protein [Kordiimonas sp.]|uniref:glycosyltransferase family 4 protein n=1 Tax=Kordiimonas sp. TaxID=1970157 RepID=UPI003A8D6B18
MNKPVILVDGHVLDGKPQGSGAYLAGLYNEVARQDLIRVMVACHDEASLSRWYPNAPNIEWVPLKATNKYKRLAFELPGLQARINPSYGHFHYICPLRKTGPWINTIHDLLFVDHPQHFPLGYRIKNRLLFQLSALRSDIILTTSNYSRNTINRHFGIDLDRIHITPAAPDTFTNAKATAISGLTPQRFLVYVSRFEPRKNQHALVQAFHSVLDELPQDIQLVLVGYPALEYPELDKALAEAGDRVIVTSNLSHEQLTWLYRNAAASIYPSLAEGFGMPVIEAVAAGGISYCADNTAMSELVPSVHGSFDGSDIGAIRETIRRAVAGSDTACREAVKAKTLKAYSWKASAEALMRAINV